MPALNARAVKATKRASLIALFLIPIAIVVYSASSPEILHRAAGILGANFYLFVLVTALVTKMQKRSTAKADIQ